MSITARTVVLLALAPGAVTAQLGGDSQIGRVAVFPLEHDRLTREDGVLLAERVAERLAESNRGVAVLGPSGVTVRLDAAGLRDSWDRFVFTLTMTGIADPVELARVCDGLEVDALVQMEVATWIQGGAIVEYEYSIAPRLRVSLRVWLFDCVPPGIRGERWSEGRAIGGVSRRQGLTDITAASTMAAVGAAVDAMLGRLPPLVPDSLPAPAAVRSEG